MFIALRPPIDYFVTNGRVVDGVLGSHQVGRLNEAKILHKGLFFVFFLSLQPPTSSPYLGRRPLPHSDLFTIQVSLHIEARRARGNRTRP